MRTQAEEVKDAETTSPRNSAIKGAKKWGKHWRGVQIKGEVWFLFVFLSFFFFVFKAKSYYNMHYAGQNPGKTGT